MKTTIKMLAALILIGLGANAQPLPINISTGIDNASNALPVGISDPFWQITNSPNAPGTPARSCGYNTSFWQPTPVATTNAGWINVSATPYGGNAIGGYTFERSIIVAPGSPTLSCNFSVAYDDVLETLQLVAPDNTVTTLTAIPNPASYFLSNTITNSIANPAPGIWKIRVIVGFVDSFAGFLLSGSINFNQPLVGTTQVRASQCGVTLPLMTTLIGIDAVAGATSYNIEATNIATGIVQTFPRTAPNFSLANMAAFDYGATYAIRIQYFKNGVWSAFGSMCNVSAPPIPGLNASLCGATLSGINTAVVTASLAYVTGYRFRVTDLTDPTGVNQVQIVNTLPPYNYFSLQGLARYNYGTTYSVEVAVKTNGGFSAYGPICNVTSPAVSSLANCGAVVVSNAVHIVTTPGLNGVTKYRFLVTNLLTSQTTTIVQNAPNNWFSFNSVPGYSLHAGYSVCVQLETTGRFSPSGNACTITSPALRTGNPDAFADTPSLFKAIAYPNPFSDHFSVDLNNKGNEAAELKVYDLMGLQLENKMVPANESEINALGQNWKPGVYSVIINIGNDIRTLKVIKK
ncbi:MAG TPA: T9SS type A sorting domain-containing protein [Flavobacterium sp.]|nr:T9SS type A sorting domain-containing protein [Flavobacterium sp.]